CLRLLRCAREAPCAPRLAATRERAWYRGSPRGGSRPRSAAPWRGRRGAWRGSSVSSIDRAAELAKRPAHVGLHGAERKARMSRHLLVGEPAIESERDQLALRRGKRVDRYSEAMAKLCLLEAVAGIA